MKWSWALLLGLSLAGCMASNSLQYDAMAETNQYHIARVRKGMSQKQVLYIMHKPYSYESFESGDDIYDVWFYVTRTTGLDQTRMVPQNLTPLTFKNGVLVGTGYSWYYYAMREQTLAAAAENPPPEKPKSTETEDLEFEKALKTFPEKPAAPSQTPTTAIPRSDSDQWLQLGLSEMQVLNAMGEPMDYQTFEMAGDIYDIWFYETLPKTNGTSLMPQNLTPLVFKNAFLFSMKEADYFRIKEISDREVVLASRAGTKSRIQVGMSETEVINMLGSPSRYETYQLNSDVYDVWFYSGDKAPLIFKNSLLVGMTLEYYNGIKDAASKEQINGYDREEERMEEDESEQNFNYW